VQFNAVAQRIPAKFRCVTINSSYPLGIVIYGVAGSGT
jgi:hypothetical protein